MSNKQRIFIVIGLIAIIVVSFVSGLLIGQKNSPKNDLAISAVYGETFYASIESIKQYDDGSFHINVKGLEVNDINYRGDFTFKVDDSINMTWRGKKINVSDLKEGDNISITFTDEIINSISPTPLDEVVKVQLLRDEENLAKTYNLDILNIDEISSVTIDTLSEFRKVKGITDKETIEIVYNVFNNKTTQIESVNDNPINPDILFSVTFKNDKGNYKSAYIYKKDNQYYIEQHYNGIYETSLDDFKTIEEIAK